MTTEASDEETALGLLTEIEALCYGHWRQAPHGLWLDTAAAWLAYHDCRYGDVIALLAAPLKIARQLYGQTGDTHAQ